MNIKNSYDSAFPVIEDNNVSQWGLTKREYFAAMAMQGIASKFDPSNLISAKDLTDKSVEIADKLINSLNEK